VLLTYQISPCRKLGVNREIGCLLLEELASTTQEISFTIISGAVVYLKQNKTKLNKN